MLPPPAYLEARLRATYHAQVEVEDRELGDTPAALAVHGRVRRVFRGGGVLIEGDVVRFVIHVTRLGERIPPGGEAWMPFEQFEAASHFEGFFDGAPPDCIVPLSQVFRIHALSDAPQFPAPSEDELAVHWARFHGHGRAPQVWPAPAHASLVRRLVDRITGRRPKVL